MSLAMAVFILILLVKKVPALIGGALDGRIAQIKEQLAEASRLRAEAEALKGEYEAKLAAAAGEADAMRKAAEHEAEVLVDDARTHAEELVVRRQKVLRPRAVQHAFCVLLLARPAGEQVGRREAMAAQPVYQPRRRQNGPVRHGPPNRHGVARKEHRRCRALWHP